MNLDQFIRTTCVNLNPKYYDRRSIFDFPGDFTGSVVQDGFDTTFYLRLFHGSSGSAFWPTTDLVIHISPSDSFDFAYCISISVNQKLNGILTSICSDSLLYSEWLLGRNRSQPIFTNCCRPFNPCGRSDPVTYFNLEDFTSALNSVGLDATGYFFDQEGKHPDLPECLTEPLFFHFVTIDNDRTTQFIFTDEPPVDADLADTLFPDNLGFRRVDVNSNLSYLEVFLSGCPKQNIIHLFSCQPLEFICQSPGWYLFNTFTGDTYRLADPEPASFMYLFSLALQFIDIYLDSSSNLLLNSLGEVFEIRFCPCLPGTTWNSLYKICC